MSFYYIQNTRLMSEYEMNYCSVDLDIGVFDQEGIDDAKNLLYSECYKIISRECDRKQSILKSHQEEQKVLSDMLKYFNTVDKVTQSKDAVIERLNHLEKKIADETAETQRLIKILDCFENTDEVIKEAGYKIVEIPVLDYCDNDILKELM